MLAKLFNQRGADGFNADRRHFIIGAIATGTSLVIGYSAMPKSLAADAAATPAPANPFTGYLKIAADNKVTIISSQFESGQGIYHGIATLVQEELEADWSMIDVVGGYGNPALYSNPILGMQSTGGSTGTSISFDRYRRAGALAKAMLMGAAAQEWKVPVGDIVAKNGVLSHRSGKRGSYGSFAQKAARQALPADVRLKAPSAWIYIGNEKLPRFDSRRKTNGSEAFTIDVRLPGMLTAVMIHPPLFGAKLLHFDGSAAKAIKGVVDVVQTPRGIAVVADHMWTALKARPLVVAQWDDSNADKTSTTELLATYRALAAKDGDALAVQNGDPQQAFAKAARIVEATYEFPFLAHAPLEPLNAVVRMNADGTLEIWGGHQYQDTYQALAAKAAGIAPDKVILRVMKTGGSFGRRAVFDADVIYEALMTAKALNYRAPVKVQWTREDDMRAGQYRPAYVHQLKAGIDAEGKLIAWRDTIVGQSLCRGTPFEAWMKDGVDPTTVEGAANMPYHVPNMRVDSTSPVLGIPVTFWRSVGMNHSGYAVESFMDEIAYAAGKDPLEYRLSMLEKHPRLANVLKLAAAKAAWGSALPPGRARGIAVGETFGTCVAQVAEVSAENGAVRVHRVVCAIDCGLAVNPDQIRAQMEGGIGFGLGAVLKSQITLDKGVVVQSNFHDFDVLRLNEMPRIDVIIVKSDAPPTGAGEPGVPPIGPAVANAWFALTRKRVRSLPFFSGHNA
ncbi:MAG: xanthine dehydrogenase family protein molybdopterin-binding subunit [Pseudomonadota bacterium]